MSKPQRFYLDEELIAVRDSEHPGLIAGFTAMDDARRAAEYCNNSADVADLFGWWDPAEEHDDLR